MFQQFRKNLINYLHLMKKNSYYMVFHWITEGNCHSIFLQDANTLVLKKQNG